MATKNVINDIKSNPSQILPDLWGNLNQAIPNLTNPVTSPLIPANAAAGMIGSTVGSIGDTLKSTLQTGEGMMGLGNNPNVPQAMSPKEKAQYAANSPMTNLVNAAGGAANLGGIALGLGLPKGAPTPTDTMPDMPSNTPTEAPVLKPTIAKWQQVGLKGLSPDEQALIKNTPVNDLVAANPKATIGDIQEVSQIQGGHPLLANYDEATKTGNSALSNSIAQEIIKDPNYKPYHSTFQQILDQAGPVKPPVEENGIFGSQKGGIDFNAKIGGGDTTPQILDKNGNPIQSQNAAADVGGNPPQGSYVLDKNGNLTPNPAPSEPTMAPEPSTEPPLALNPTGQVHPEMGETLPPYPKPPVDTTAPVEPAPLPQGPGKTITRVNLPASVYGAGNEAQVQNTIDQYVPGNTAVDQYKNLQPTLDNFGKQIDYQIAKTPQTATLHDMMTNYDKNLENAGIYRTSGSSKGVLQATAQKYVRQLTGISSDEGDVTSQSLADSLQKVNKDAGPVFKKIENGSKLMPQDEVILAARQTIRDTLTNMYGGKGGIVDTLLQKQGDLYDAADSLHAGRAAELKIMDKPGIMSNVLTNVKQDPVKAALEGVAGVGAAIYGASKIAGPIGTVIGGLTSGQGNSVPGQVKPTTYNQIKPQDIGLIDEQTHGKNQADAQAGYNENKLNDPNKANEYQAQAVQDQTKYDSQANVRGQLTKYNTAANLATTASNDLRGAPASIFNANQSYEGMMLANNGKYSKLAGDINALSQAVGYNLFTAKSPDALRSMIDAAVNKEKAALTGTQTTFGTQASPMVSQPAAANNPMPPMNWQQNDPKVQAVMQAGQAAAQGLPPIQ